MHIPPPILALHVELNDRTIIYFFFFIYKNISRHNVHCGIQRRSISSQNNMLIHQCKVVLTK